MSPLDQLIQLLARLPGLGPRSARRAALHLVKRREALMEPLAAAMAEAARAIRPCARCGNLDTVDPCSICADPGRDPTTVCVVEDVADVWAIERTQSYRGLYHVLGGMLSALEGTRPEDLRIPLFWERVGGGMGEVIIALDATVEGQPRAHYIAARLAPLGVKAPRLAHGVPVGGELDYLDEGTLTAALKAR